MKTPLVSILMTAYNREKYIAEAIESVLTQTYTNWELIIVDDGSTDSTVAIAKTFAQKDPRVAVYVNERNLGDYGNRNKAASYAKGVYIKYIDADDALYVHTLQAMVHAMLQFPDAAYGFSFFGKQDDSCKYPIKFMPKDAYEEHFLKKSFFYQGPGGAIISKQHFDEVGGFSGKRYIGDTELWLKLSAKYPCVLFWPTLIWWRKHEEQENVYEKKDYQALVSRHLLVMEFLKNNNPLHASDCKGAIANFERIYCHKIIKFLLSGNVDAARVLQVGYPMSIMDLLISIFPKKVASRYFKQKA